MQNNNMAFSLPNSLTAHTQTDKTDITDLTTISNADFMRPIWGTIIDNERPIVVSFPGSPKTVKKGLWFGNPWNSNNIELSSDHNNYMSLACFTPDATHGYRRQKQYFSKLLAIMLDDIGSKVSKERVTLSPSWVIETSKGNYQYGYMLNEPLTSVSEVNSLTQLIIDAGLTDPGSNDFCTRLARLPVAINGKQSDDDRVWQCKLIVWQPELRYTTQQLIEGLQIDLNKSSHPKKKGNNNKHKALNQAYHDNNVYIPRASENPVVVKIKASGHYKSLLREGAHDITCPWVHEHTDHSDQGTAYFEPNDAFPIGGFKCMHGHCAQRRVTHLLDFLKINIFEAKHKPIIVLTQGELMGICDAAEKELAKTGSHYQQKGIIVTINIHQDKQKTTITPATLSDITLTLANIITWQRYDHRSKTLLICDPPEKHITILFNKRSYPYLPVLNGIARQPYFRPNGCLVIQDGYDTESGLYGIFNVTEFNIPETPTRQQAEEALASLSELLSEFSFQTEHDKTAALLSIITAVIRPSLAHAPMIHVKAPIIASGKSYLCELITVFATPQKGTPHAFPADDTECRKLLLSELLRSPAVIEFDNMTNDLLPHTSLCTALTNEFIAGRILGRSKTTEVSTCTLFLSSGNNVGPIGDMTRRTLTINLDPTCEKPATRMFNKQPVHDVRTNRGFYVSAVLTLIKAWHCAGKPITDCKPIASYNDWSNMCRQPLLWLNLSDPAINIFEAMNDDPDRGQLGEFLQAFQAAFGETTTTVKEMAKTPNHALREIIMEFAAERDGSINNKKLGHWLKRHARRWIMTDGIQKRLINDKSIASNVVRWKLEVVDSL